jgi:hypothetical protein
MRDPRCMPTVTTPRMLVQCGKRKARPTVHAPVTPPSPWSSALTPTSALMLVQIQTRSRRVPNDPRLRLIRAGAGGAVGRQPGVGGCVPVASVWGPPQEPPTAAARHNVRQLVSGGCVQLSGRRCCLGGSGRVRLRENWCHLFVAAPPPGGRTHAARVDRHVVHAMQRPHGVVHGPGLRQAAAEAV